MLLLAVLTIIILIRSNRRFKNKKEAEDGDVMFNTIISTEDKSHIWPLLMVYITEQQRSFIQYAAERYRTIADAFINENAGVLRKSESSLIQGKNILKNARRKETLCLRLVPHETAIEKTTWFYLGNNLCMSILYNLRRINEVCKEHVENNFLPLPSRYISEYTSLCERIGTLFGDTVEVMKSGDTETVSILRRHCEEIKDTISDTYHRVQDHMRNGDVESMTVLYVYVNMLQETQEMVSSIRKYLRAFAKLRDSEFRSRPAITATV